MALKALVRVEDYNLPEPASYSGNTSTIIDSGVNVEGKFIGSVIRDDVAKVNLSWKYLTVQQWAEINQLFRMSSGGKFVNLVTFFDQGTGTWVTKEMYISDRSAGMWRRDPEGNVLGWVNCSLNLIEV